MTDRIQTRIDAPGPKKILSLDGGGIRGLISIQILMEIERLWRARSGEPDAVLADYFDFICGTSTGAIISTLIAAGLPMQRVHDIYLENGRAMFTHTTAWFLTGKSQYNPLPIESLLRRSLNEALEHKGSAIEPWATLGSEGLRTLLMVVTRNHTTDSPWPLCNNPRAKYNQRSLSDCNLKFSLWEILRASAAAPVFFPAKQIQLDPQHRYTFQDGGVTAYNNPAFLAFQMATAHPYGINWATGVDRMLLVSVGTGAVPIAAWKDNLPNHITHLPAALIGASGTSWDMALRSLGACRFGPPLDSEFGDMVAPADLSHTTVPSLFTYVRYNPSLSQVSLNELGLSDVKSAEIHKLDAVEHMDQVVEVGKAYARRNVDVEHFGGFLKPSTQFDRQSELPQNRFADESI